MTQVTYRLTVKNREQLRNPTLGSRARAINTFFTNKLVRNVNSAFSPDQSVLSFRSSAQLLHGRSAADASPAYAAPPSFVPYTNRPFGHQRRYTKRLTVADGRNKDYSRETAVQLNATTKDVCWRKKQREAFRRTALTPPPHSVFSEKKDGESV